MDEVVNIATSFCSLSIYSLKNKKCEFLNNKIELLDERFYDMNVNKKKEFPFDVEFFK